MKENSFKLLKDDRDWLLELGKTEGESRIVRLTDPLSQNLIRQFRPPISGTLSLPWNASHNFVRFMPGKVTVWSGPTFSGKTQMLRQLMMYAMNSKHRVLFCSLEEEPADVLREFICMAFGTRRPEPYQIQAFMDWYADRLFIFDSTEIIDPEAILGIARYMAHEHKVSHVVIDSLMRLNLRIDDYDGQRQMGNMLGRVARTSGAHIHLVAHPRKTANSRTPIDLYDIRGAQDIVAQADSVITLERKHEETEFTNLLTIWKQRGELNWSGEIKLHYHAESRQLLFNRFDNPMEFIPGMRATA